MTAHDLTYRYPSTGNGIDGISLNLPRGSFTVVTGRIGSGKTTLLRALLGLVPLDYGGTFAGTVWQWTIRVTSSLRRAPRTRDRCRASSSDTLRNNILMGQPEEATDLDGAISRRGDGGRICLIWKMGWRRWWGRGGVKLSGGQIQRTATARMMARQPELYVFR